MHAASNRRIHLFVLNCAVLIMAIGFLSWIDRWAIGARVVPQRSAGHDAPIYRVSRQQDVYPIYKSAGLRGARVIHLNRFFNMQAYLPKEQFITTPFPVPVKALPNVFEPGIDSHSWLYIATRMGLVRTVTTVLPDQRFGDVLSSAPPGGLFDHRHGTIRGYSYDIRRLIVTLDSLPGIDEPVIVNADAGFFTDLVDPVKTASLVKKKCPDVRLLVLIDSLDEPEVTAAMREQLRLFEDAWRAER